ncbi:hypothetical protein D9758_006886 [Tetrapyrgos nigripes]|uniref:Cytochrome P450 n=1 Tax=Tetrapyrgos nigripes TaxID=182062 RepID=A0A8H5LUA7_9AGAR|nr:hypothetical protein D9758_006886 [Tetrapyrgos nigripes]
MTDRVAVLGTLFCLVVILNQFLKSSNRYTHGSPPDPPETRLPTKLPWKRYYEWFQTSSHPVMSLSLPGNRKVLLVSGMEALHTLYTTRSSIYSTRPLWRMARLIGRQNNVAFTPYGEKLKTARRFLISTLGQKQITNWGALLDKEVTLVMKNLLELDNSKRDSEVSDLIHLHISDIVTLLTYGHRATPQYIAESEAIGHDTGLSLIPGKWAIEGFPFLQYIPANLPGMNFKRWAMQAKTRFEALVGHEFEQVQKGMEDKTAPSCFVSDTLANGVNPKDMPILKSTAGSLYSAATDTTTAILHSALYLLALHPTIQKKAYSYLSSYTSPPSISDESSLPYITAITRELHRFRPVVTLINHAPLSDDVYEDWRIEKGIWVMGNLWSVCHNEEIYPEPELFVPERHLDALGQIDPTVRDPRSVTFGFGRRRCPGENFANAHVFLFLSRLLWLFEILPGDKLASSIADYNNRVNGTSIDKQDLLEYTSTFISGPKKENFDVKLRLRNEALRESFLSYST